MHASERQHVEDAQLRHLPVAAAEPAPPFDVPRQNLLEEDAIRRRHLRGPGELHHGRLVCRFAGDVGGGLRFLEREPVELVHAEREQVGQLADGGKRRLPEQLARLAALVGAEVQLDVLHAPRKVRHHQNGLVLVLADERQHVRVVGGEELDRAAAERLEPLA